MAFLGRLLEAGVDVRFADLPQIEGPSGRFMLQQMASVAVDLKLSAAATMFIAYFQRANGLQREEPRTRVRVPSRGP